MTDPGTKVRATDTWLALAFKLAVVLPVLVGESLAVYLVPHILLNPRPGDSVVHLLAWTLVVAVVELLPVPVSQVLRLSLSFPILLAVAILYESPLVVGVVTVLGLFDPRELRGEVSLLTALFNRCQTALAFAAGNLVFHSVAAPESSSNLLIPFVVLATVATYSVNVTLVAAYMHLVYGKSLREVLLQLRVGALTEFLLSYLGLGFVGVVIARLYDAVGLWSIAAFILPLVFARQMFFRNMALEEAGKELKDREQVMRALSNRMAEERQDERMQIAAYLHDDLAQMLFRLNLQVEMAKKRLAQGDIVAVARDLDGILGTKQETSDAIRALIRDLHRSPIGRRGLAEAIQSFAEDMTKGHRTTVDTDVIEVSLPPPIQLLIYQIAREAAMNALKHAEADNIWISLQEEAEGGVRLIIRDDGKGFDTSAPPPEGHFGSVMMRERALVAKGTFSIESEPGSGTTIAATFPPVWVEEGTQLEASGVPGGDGRSGAGQRPPVGSTVGPRRAGTTGEATSPGSEQEARNGQAGEPVAVSLGPKGQDREEPGPGEPEQSLDSIPEREEKDRSDPPRRRAIPA
jgi:signal transduction histidine kinase